MNRECKTLNREEGGPKYQGGQGARYESSHSGVPVEQFGFMAKIDRKNVRVTAHFTSNF